MRGGPVLPLDMVSIERATLERLAPTQARICGEDDGPLVWYDCCQARVPRSGHLDYRPERRAFTPHAADCPWVKARKAMGDRGGLAAVRPPD